MIENMLVNTIPRKLKNLIQLKIGFWQQDALFRPLQGQDALFRPLQRQNALFRPLQ